MPTTIKAKKVKGKTQKPSDCNAKGACPCNVFERCRKRRPYGSDVWSNGERKQQAMGAIAFDGSKGITDEGRLDALLTRFKYRNEAITAYNNTHEKKWRFNEFFANIRSAGGACKNALVLPEISDLYITQQMDQLKSSIYNTAPFTDFQRSMVARANLVRNGLTLKSDKYRTKEGEQDFDPKNVLPYARGSRMGMWSVDHIQIRSKGGCNRFCNSAVLMLEDNIKRNDNGPCCPCITAVEKKGEQPELDEFTPETSEESKNSQNNLYVCVTYHRNKKEGEALEYLPGTCHANKKCNLDDPRKYTGVLKNPVVRPVYKN